MTVGTQDQMLKLRREVPLLEYFDVQMEPERQKHLQYKCVFVFSFTISTTDVPLQMASIHMEREVGILLLFSLYEDQQLHPIQVSLISFIHGVYKSQKSNIILLEWIINNTILMIYCS